MVIKHYKTNEQIREGCSIAHAAGLYNLHGSMRGWYMDPRRFVETMFICYNEKDAPVGSFIIVNFDNTDNYYNCGTFVEKNHRRLGYGKKMIEVALSLGYHIVPWKDGIIANLFYNSANV